MNLRKFRKDIIDKRFIRIFKQIVKIQFENFIKQPVSNHCTIIRIDILLELLK